MSKNVIFGTGPLGTWVAQELRSQDHDVTMVNRDGKTRNELQQDLKVVAGDATDPRQVTEICKDAEAVFHCAVPPYTQWPELMPALSKGILDGVSQTKARLIFGDNLYCYGPTGGAPLTEDLPYTATGRKGKVRAETAQIYMDAHVAGKCPVVIGRGSDFFGPQVINSVFGEMFFGPALKGETVKMLGNLKLPHTFTYIKDFAKGLVTLSQSDKALGQAWHIPNAPTLSTADFVTLIEKELGTGIKTMAAGKGLIGLLALFNPMMREMKEMMYEWTEDYVVDHSKYEKVFGAGYTSLDTAIKETVEWYQSYLAK